MNAQTTVWVCMALGIVIVAIDFWTVTRTKKAALKKLKQGMKRP